METTLCRCDDPMRSSLILTIVIVAVASVIHWARAANVSDFIDFSLRSGATALLPGRLYVPPEAISDPTTLRPFILFLHGGGEAGATTLPR